MSSLKTVKADNGWDLDMVNGDLVLIDDYKDIVLQRVVFRLMTWFQECPYDRSIGIPYLNLFGFEPVEAVVFLITREIAETEGVDEVIEVPEYLLGNDRTLRISCQLRIEDELVPFSLEVSP
jgi:hypothetical protein